MCFGEDTIDFFILEKHETLLLYCCFSLRKMKKDKKKKGKTYDNEIFLNVNAKTPSNCLFYIQKRFMISSEIPNDAIDSSE